MIVTSFAPSGPSSGAAHALDTLASRATAPLRRGERIEIGDVSDAGRLAAIRALVQGRGTLVVDRDPARGVSILSVDLAPAANADELLAALWKTGASDAFVLRD